MRRIRGIVSVVCFGFTLSVSLPVCVSSAATTIVVDCGRFASAAVAGEAEEQVDWLDADQADDTACTQCFAAVELQRYLRRMTGRNDDFNLVDDDAELPTAGDLIFVGKPGLKAIASRVAHWTGAR